MTRDGLVTTNDVLGFHLTEKGYEMARSVMRRHMLTEWLLMTVFESPLVTNPF